MSNSGSLPGYASWRYSLTTTRFKGRADITIRDRQTGDQVTHNDVGHDILDRPRRIPEAEVDAVIRDMVRLADARRPDGDPIGEAARAAVAVSRLRRMHRDMSTGAPREQLVDPMAYAVVLEHLADLAGTLVEVTDQGADMCATFEGFCLDADEREGAQLWETAQTKIANAKAGARGAEKGLRAAAVKVDESIGHAFDCGDCTSGVCHWGGGDQPGGRLATARAREAAGESCGCERHPVSVRLRQARRRDGEGVGEGGEALAWADAQVEAQIEGVPPGADFDVTVQFADGGIPLEEVLAAVALHAAGDDVEAAGRIIGEWYGEHVDAAGALVGRVAAWASGAGRVPAGEIAGEIDALVDAGDAETLAGLGPHLSRPPVVLPNLGSDIADLLLNGLDPRVLGREAAAEARFVDAAGRPFPRFKLTTAPAELDREQLTQFAREVHAKFTAEREAVEAAGAALFDVPGRGLLLVPAGFDLAEICIRLGVDVAFEQRTRAPSDPIIIDDPAPREGLGGMRYIGGAEFDPPAQPASVGSDTMRLEVPTSLAGTCDSPRACCPEHGATLVPVKDVEGGPIERTACKRPGCPRVWEGDRLGEPCEQLANYAASAPELHPQTGEMGGEVDVCGGHAEQLIEWGWSVRVRRPSYMSAEHAAAIDRAFILRCQRAARRNAVVAAARALFTDLGFSVRDIGDGTPSYRGEFPNVVLSVSGPRSSWRAEAVFVHDRGPDVFVYSTGWYHGADGSDRLSWESLVERLALVAGAELPGFVLAAREADGSVEAAAEALAAHVDAVIAVGFRAGVFGDPRHEVSVTFEGYGRKYGTIFRYDVSVATLVFAGAWRGDDELGEAPLTWSSWPAFVDHVRRIAEGAEEAID